MKLGTIATTSPISSYQNWKFRKFAGDTTAWMKFTDLFESTSSRSSNLSDVEKCNHLLP